MWLNTFLLLGSALLIGIAAELTLFYSQFMLIEMD